MSKVHQVAASVAASVVTWSVTTAATVAAFAAAGVAIALSFAGMAWLFWLSVYAASETLHFLPMPPGFHAEDNL